MGSVVIEVCDSAVRCHLRVDVASFLLVEVDFCLQDIDFLSLRLKLGSKYVFLHLDITLFLFILVVEDLLIRAIQLTIKLELFCTELLYHIKQVGVHGDGCGQLTLGGSKVGLGLLLFMVATIFHLLEFVLKIKYYL